MKSTKVLKNLPAILTGKKVKSSKKTIKRKKNSCVRLVGNIRAFTVLSLSKRKLNSLDDEEELFRSVLISNTMKSVRQEMTGSCRLRDKEVDKKYRDKMVTRVKNRLDLLGLHGRGRWRLWTNQRPASRSRDHSRPIRDQGRLRIWRRGMARLLTRNKKLKRVKSVENLL